MGSVYEPPYLDKGPQPECYEDLNICIKGYDFAVLESFHKYVHNLTKSFDLETESFATPTKSGKVSLYELNSTKVKQDFDLKVYERVVRVPVLPSTVAPLLFEVINTNLPEGVQLSVREFPQEEEDFRYVPDTMLTDLRQQVETSTRSIQELKGK